MNDVMQHPWFTSVQFDWNAMLQKSLKAPYVPMNKNPGDEAHFDPRTQQASALVPTFTGHDTFEGF
jgi:hypothetical protein